MTTEPREMPDELQYFNGETWDNVTAIEYARCQDQGYAVRELYTRTDKTQADLTEANRVIEVALDALRHSKSELKVTKINDAPTAANEATIEIVEKALTEIRSYRNKE